MTGRTTSRAWTRRATAALVAVGLVLNACGDPTAEPGAGDADDVATVVILPPPHEPVATPPAVGEPTPAMPVGEVDDVSTPVLGVATVSGWADDLANDEPVTVTATLDGVAVASVVAADEHTGGNGSTATGFAVDLVTTAGPHQVCITAEDTTIGCVDVDVETAGVPTGPTIALTEVRPRHDDTVAVRGVVLGGDTAPADIVVTPQAGTVTGHLGTEAVNEVPVVARTFRFDLHDLPDGATYVCPGRHDPEPDPDGRERFGAGSGTAVRVIPDRALGDGDIGGHGGARGCGTVVHDDVVSIGTTGYVDGIEAVGPTVDHPVHVAQRDGGISVRLSDGSVLWLFGDTFHEVDGREYPVYFIHNTAAWAAADAPTVTRDAADSAGTPHLFAVPPAGTCDASPLPKATLWPEAAVAIPQSDGTDRVVVVMSKVCVGTALLDIDLVGYAIVEYVHDPADPPVDEPIHGVVTQPHFADEDNCFGKSLALGPDGWIYGQHCGNGVDDPDRHCEVGRVTPEQVTEPAAWRYWNGGDPTDDASWVADMTAAAAMAMPEQCAPTYNVPIATLGLTHDTELDMWMMVYSPWPGFSDRVAVRLAEHPTGPWTEPAGMTLPGCIGTVEGVDVHCYAGTPQLHLVDEPGMIGIGWYDLETDVGRGQYLTGRAPLVVVRH